MSGISITVSEPSKGIFLDVTRRAKACKASKGRHGNLRLTVAVAMDRDLAYAFSALAGLPKMELTYQGARLWEGRIEDIAPSDEGLTLTALGKWRALSDISYTALWSDSGVKEWEKLTEDNISTAKQRLFEQDNNNRLYLAARNPEPFVNTDLAAWGYLIPDASSRSIVACQFAYTLGAGVNWRARLLTRDSAWGSGSAQWTLAGAVGAQSGIQNLVFTAAAGLTFELEATAGVTIAAATGAGAYLKITRLRLATTSANRVGTTIAAGVAAPGSQAVTPGSMVNIYAGQDLWIGSGATGEIVTVTAITSTTFTAVFTLTHAAGVAVAAIVVYADEIAEDILSAVNTLNTGALSSSTILIQSPGVDMFDCVYEDKRGDEIVDELAQRGDNAGNVWETGVADDVLYFRPAGDEAQTWAVDAETFDLTRSIEPMANQVKTVYKQADDRLLRKSALVDLFAVAEKYGIKRQAAHDVHTTSVTEAETVRAKIETASQDPAPQAKLTYKRLHKQGGTLADKTMLEAGDVLIARNLPPTLDVPPDNDVAFTVLGVDYDVLTDGQAAEIGAKTMIKTLSGTDKPVVVNARRKPFLLAAKG